MGVISVIRQAHVWKIKNVCLRQLGKCQCFICCLLFNV